MILIWLRVGSADDSGHLWSWRMVRSDGATHV